MLIVIWITKLQAPPDINYIDYSSADYLIRHVGDGLVDSINIMGNISAQLGALVLEYEKDFWFSQSFITAHSGVRIFRIEFYKVEDAMMVKLRGLKTIHG